jgi:hypothetical protein
MALLKELTIDERSTELETPEWQSAKLVTPRHATKDLWNARALRQFSARSKKQIYRWESEKLVNGEFADSRASYELEKQKQRRRGAKSTQSRFLEVCEGADVMVTVNVDTDMDLANGTRGTVEEIILAEDEPQVGSEQVVMLEKMPLLLLVRLEKTRATQIEGLAPNVIPIHPFDTKTKVAYRKGSTDVAETVVKRQFPLILGFAFTDYRAQGQTIPKVIVDLATPATGKAPTQFNFYVSLSRGTGRKNIRILRQFDETIFGDPWPTDLMDEDDRLEAMDIKTERIWERIKAQM